MDERPRGGGDDGFTLIEQMIAITLMFAVILGLLVTLGTGGRLIGSGRQATVATSLGKGAIETFQGKYHDATSYEAAIGMNVAAAASSGDPRISTLAGSPTLTGVGRLVNAAAPVFTPHRWSVTEAGAAFTVHAYVTEAGTTAGDRTRRLTVIVEWASGSRPRQVQLTSLVAPVTYAAFPAADGSAEVGGGSVEVTGEVAAAAPADITLTAPAARSTSSDATLRVARGLAIGPDLTTSGTLSEVPTGCEVDLLGLTGCAPFTLDAVADNDAATPIGPRTASGFVPTVFLGRDVALPAGTVVAAPSGDAMATSTAESSATAAPAVGDVDGRPSGRAISRATGTAAVTVPPGVLGLGGELFTTTSLFGNPWIADATVDHVTASSGSVLTTAALAISPFTILQLPAAPIEFHGAVRLEQAVSVSTSARAGNGVLSLVPSITVSPGTAVIRLWDGATGSYRDEVLGIGTDQVLSAGGTIVSGTDTIQFTTHVETSAKVVADERGGGGTTRLRGVAQLPRVLRISVDVTVTSLGGAIRNFSIIVDLGHITAQSGWAVQP